MYIEPNTNIKILKNVPLDPSYDHTIYFANANAQSTYFQTKTKYTLDRQSYQRVQRGYMRVSIQAENLYDCNYVMFQNTAFGSKWFYAFIKSVEYVNNEVSQVEFQIDIMQTWFFDYELDKCFVEREHSETDGLFENIITENLEIGDEYVCNDRTVFDMNEMSVCALINKNTTQGTAESKSINNVYVPLHIIAGMRVSEPNTVDYVLNNYLEDEIVGVYQYPSILGDASTTTPTTYHKDIFPSVGNIDGYIPKNKKLYSYPFNFLLVSNNSGQTATYRWEDWDAESYAKRFNITGVFVSTPSVICYPTNYRGVTDDYDDGLVLANFPQCPWAGDMYKAWWAQNKAGFVTSGLTSVVSSLGSGIMTGIAATAFSSNPAVGVAAAVLNTGISIQSTVANCMAKVDDIQNTPSQTHGQTQTDSLNAGIGRVRFDFYSMCIKSQYAKIIDEYFDRYGYATKRNKVPNRNVRPHWTFTKTIGCTITGSIPADDAVAICEIYNNGITFWNNGNEVGNYNLDNTV